MTYVVFQIAKVFIPQIKKVYTKYWKNSYLTRLENFIFRALIHTCAHAHSHTLQGKEGKLRAKKAKFPHFPNAPSGFHSIFRWPSPGRVCGSPLKSEEPRRTSRKLP